jgi:hypothetical protein
LLQTDEQRKAQKTEGAWTTERKKICKLQALPTTDRRAHKEERETREKRMATAYKKCSGACVRYVQQLLAGGEEPKGKIQNW